MNPHTGEEDTAAMVVDGREVPNIEALKQAVIDAARAVRQARRDRDAGCPEPIAPRHMALNIALDALDTAEGL